MVCPVSSTPADNLLIRKIIILLNCWLILAIRQFKSCSVWRFQKADQAKLIETVKS